MIQSARGFYATAALFAEITAAEGADVQMLDKHIKA